MASASLVVYQDSLRRTGANHQQRALLDGLNRKGWRVQLVLDEIKHELVAPWKPLRAPQSRRAWEELLRQVNAQAVIGVFGRLIPFALSARALGLPAIWFCHHPSWQPHEGSPSVAEYQRARALALAVFDEVVVANQWMKKELLPPRGIHCSVIPNGIDLKRFSLSAARPRALRVRWGFEEKHFVLGCVGRFLPYKGQERVLRAFREGFSRFPHLRLVLVGPRGGGAEAAEFSELTRLVEEWKLQGVVRFFHGTDPEMPQVYGSLDLLVQASQRESFSLVVVESLACGTPVLSLSHPAVRETLAGYPSTGFFASDAEMIDRLMHIVESRDLRDTLKKVGKPISRRFGIERCVESVDRLLHNRIQLPKERRTAPRAVADATLAPPRISTDPNPARFPN